MANFVTNTADAEAFVQRISSINFEGDMLNAFGYLSQINTDWQLTSNTANRLVVTNSVGDSMVLSGAFSSFPAQVTAMNFTGAAGTNFTASGSIFIDSYGGVSGYLSSMSLRSPQATIEAGGRIYLFDDIGWSTFNSLHIHHETYSIELTGSFNTNLTYGTLNSLNVSHGGESVSISGTNISVQDLATQSFDIDQLWALAATGDDVVTGSHFDEVLIGYDGNDTIYGKDGIDFIMGSRGNDVIDGGNGLDYAFFSGNSSEYAINLSTSSATVLHNIQNGDGFDRLSNVERLAFEDGLVALDVDQWDDAGSAYRLYKAAFDREPDEAGLGYWIDQLDNGAPLQLAASGFIESAEFASLYGSNPSDTAFLTKLYNNVLDRDPDQGGLNYWTQQLNHGLSREEALINFSESNENVSNVAGLIEHGIHYQMWLG